MAYRILSFSGGGIRGIFQAAYLREVAGALSNPLYRNFELVAGTSTGAILALGVALGIEPEVMVQLFRLHGPAIFTSRWFGAVRSGPRYQQAALRSALAEAFGNRRLGDTKIPVVIAAVKLNTFTCRGFSTVKGAISEDHDKNLTAVDVALASSAAPTYFPSVKPEGEERGYLDGGVWANDPSLLAILYAHRYQDIPFNQIRLVSIGNGEAPQGELSDDFDQRMTISPAMVGSIFELMFSTQKHISDWYAATLIGQENIFKVNCTLKTPVRLDDAAAAIAVLPSHAQEEARGSGSAKLLKSFLDPPVLGGFGIEPSLPPSTLPPSNWQGPRGLDHRDNLGASLPDGLLPAAALPAPRLPTAVAGHHAAAQASASADTLAGLNALPAAAAAALPEGRCRYCGRSG
jgi:uncharacterized protein